MSLGITFPFQLSTGSLGYFEVTNDVLTAIESNARALLSTNWGERPMHSDLGCNLREFVFEPRTPQLRGRVADRIISQFKKWLPFLVVDKLFLIFTADDPSIPENGIRIKLELLFGNRVVLVTQTVSP